MKSLTTQLNTVFLNDYIKCLQSRIEHLKSEVCFLRGELKDKNAFAKTLFNPGSDNKNQKNVYGNQDRRLCVTTNESNILLSQYFTLQYFNNRDNNNKSKYSSNTKNTVLSTQIKENNNDNNEEHEKNLENSNITVENKEIEGNTMNHTKSNVHLAAVHGQEENPTEKSILILGESMVTHINGWDLAKKIKSNCKVKVYVKPFRELRQIV